MTYGHLLKDPVLILLLGVSLVSWAIIVDRMIALFRASKADNAYLRERKSPTSAISQLFKELDGYSNSDRDHLLIVADTSIALKRNKLERGLPLLGVIGSIAPYMGLLGTVIGIIQAFQAVQAENNMSPSIVAGGIATALIATAMGLAVAIPSVAAHHLLVAAINKRIAVWEAAIAECLPTSQSADAKESNHGSLSLP
jgi:biopolymer transport protein ExbB/TolQ